VKRLTDILETMEIPENNKDISRLRNVRWLLRNLAVNNNNHKDLAEAIEILTEIRRKK
jgi:hypothetical protein